MVDLSAINLLRNFHFVNTDSQVSMTEVVKVQYDLIKQTKNVVATVCDNIAKDVEYLLAPVQVNRVFFDIDKTDRKIYLDNCFNFVKLVLPVFSSSIISVLKNTSMILFFFGFIFIFILKYLGLLFTFGEITISKRYKKAYSM